MYGQYNQRLCPKVWKTQSSGCSTHNQGAGFHKNQDSSQMKGEVQTAQLLTGSENTQVPMAGQSSLASFLL